MVAATVVATVVADVAAVVAAVTGVVVALVGVDAATVVGAVVRLDAVSPSERQAPPTTKAMTTVIGASGRQRMTGLYGVTALAR